MAGETQSVDDLDCCSVLEDPRRRTKVVYPLPEILLLVLLIGVGRFIALALWVCLCAIPIIAVLAILVATADAHESGGCKTVVVCTPNEGCKPITVCD